MMKETRRKETLTHTHTRTSFLSSSSSFWLMETTTKKTAASKLNGTFIYLSIPATAREDTLKIHFCVDWIIDMMQARKHKTWRT